jgi:CheY-like chemotaxis protein
MDQIVKKKFEKVMLIDDNSIELQIGSHLLNKFGFGNKVSAFLGAEKALEFLKENQETIENLPEVIFLDIYMPVMTGFEFLEEYDKLSDTVKGYCKIFMLSSSNDLGDIEKATTNKNVSGFKEKPISKIFLENVASELGC